MPKRAHKNPESLPRFPFSDTIELGSSSFSADEILELLHEFVTEPRRERIADAISHRTCTITPVMEGLYDYGNASAVLRSAESMGYLTAHRIDTSKRFKIAKRVAHGAEKWIHISRWESTTACLADLKKRGYRIIATYFENATPIHEFDVTKPAAIVFGNEKEGVSEEVLEAADERLVLPMHGFSQSLNISVAAALILYHVQAERHRILGSHGDLTEKEQAILRAHYVAKSVANAERLITRRMKNRGAQPSPLS